MYKLITGENLRTVFPNIEVGLIVPNGDKLFKRMFLLEAKTHQERATFNNASRSIESPNVDEPRTRGFARDKTQRADR